MTVTAVVVHRNQPERCSETVELLRALEAVDVRVVVVDNDSNQRAVATLRAIDGIELVEAGANLGFGGGATVGLRQWLSTKEGEWALVVPHDAQPRADCLERMLAAVGDRPAAGLVSAEYGDDEIPVIDPYFGALTVPATRGEGWHATDFAHGTFLLIRRDCVEEVGLFDESYFAYCEEADLAIRARSAGWDVGIVWGAVVENPHQGTPTAAIDYLMLRNTVILVRRHFGRYKATIRFLFAAVSTGWLAVRPRRRTPWYDARARLFALRDAAIGRLGPPPAALLPE